MSEEEGVASVRIGQLDGMFLRPVQVTVSTMDGSATANEDFIPLTNTVLIFDENSTTQVVNVIVVNDNFVEELETFFVTLSTDDPSVFLGGFEEGRTRTMEIIILDDDGELASMKF